MDFLTDPSLTEEEKMALLQQMQQSQQMKQSGGGGMSPGMAMNVANQFSGGGGAAAGGGAGSGGGGGSALAAAGPWAALGAAIIANENYQRNSGNRPDDFGKQVKEGLTGEALTRDAKRYLGDDLGEVVGGLGNPIETVELMAKPEKLLKFWEWF